MPQLRDHVRAFLAGSVAALSFGYYRVHQDLWQTAELVGGRLESLNRETVSSQETLQARVVTLEAEVTKLKEMINGK